MTGAGRLKAAPYMWPQRVGAGCGSPWHPPHGPGADDQEGASVEGAVLLEVVIASDGSVADARVVQSIPLLDDAALDAARQWQFEPAVVDGVAASATVTLSFHFTLR